MAKKTDKSQDTETETAESIAESPEAMLEAESTEGLVKMHMNGTSLHMHPTTVKAHEDAGWKVA